MTALETATETELDRLLESFEVPPDDAPARLVWSPEAAERYPRTCRHGHVIEWPGDDDARGVCRACMNGYVNKYRQKGREKNGTTPPPKPRLLLDWIREDCKRLPPTVLDEGSMQAVGCLVPKDSTTLAAGGYARLGAERAHRLVAEFYLRQVADPRCDETGRLASTWTVHHACYGRDGNKACVELSHLRVWSAAKHWTHHGRLGRGLRETPFTPAEVRERANARRRAKNAARKVAKKENAA